MPERKDKNLQPTLGPLGRIVETHPGNDGKVRVVSIKFNGSIVSVQYTKYVLFQ